MEITLTKSEMEKLIRESSNEFKAKLGAGVEEKNKQINKDANKQSAERAKDYDGGLRDEVLEKKPKYVKDDFNKTTLDYTPDNATPEYNKRVHIQTKGYTSEQEMNNGSEKAGDFSDGENIYNGLKKSGEEMLKNQKELEKSGLQAREWDDKFFEKNSMYESKDGMDMRQMINHLKTVEESANKSQTPSDNNIKTVFYKKTSFITENHMIDKIPDDFKVNGLKFKMKDMNGNTYLVEWKNNKANVLLHENKVETNAEFNRMKELMGYKSTVAKTTVSSRLNESEQNFQNTLNKARDLK